MLHLSPAITAYCCLLALLLGACAGSFLNCAASRRVHGRSALRGRSHCDACGHTLAPRDLIPVLQATGFAEIVVGLGLLVGVLL